MRWRWSLSAWLAVGGAFGTWGCSNSSDGVAEEEPSGAACASDEDCEGREACVFERCHATCTSTGDCTAGARCVKDGAGGGVCQLPQASTAMPLRQRRATAAATRALNRARTEAR